MIPTTKAYDGPDFADYQPQPSSHRPQFNIMFIKSIHGIMKLLQLIICLICLICAGSALYTTSTTGWLNFVSATSLVLTIFFVFLNLFDLLAVLPGPWVIIEFIFLVFACVTFVLSMIVAAASNSVNRSSAIACAVFFAFGAVIFAVECIVRFRISKENGLFVISSTEVTTRKPHENSVASIIQSNIPTRPNNNTESPATSNQGRGIQDEAYDQA